MKKILFIILLSATFVFVFLYIKYDRKSYDYGYGCIFCNKTMPYNLKPHDGKEFSFTLNDEEGFELIGIGFRYRQSSFKINNFLSYGYNDTSVIAKVSDSLNNVKYLVSYETGYKNKKDNPEISFRDIDDNYFEQIKENYQWVEIGDKKANTTKLMKFISLVGAIVSLSFLIGIILRLKEAAQVRRQKR